jgi:hypothetical protein
MKSDLRKKLVLHRETLRALKVKTAIKAGRGPSHHPSICLACGG